MHPATPLPAALLDRPFRVSEAIELGLTRKRLRSADLWSPFHGVRVARSLGWDALLRAQAGMLVTPEGTCVVGWDAVAVAGLPLPVAMTELLALPLQVAPPISIDPPRTAGLLVDHAGLPRQVPRVVDHGVPRPSDADLWARVAGGWRPAQVAAVPVPLPRAPPGYAVILGCVLLQRGSGVIELEGALGRLPGSLRARARPVLEEVLAGWRG